MNTTTRLLLAFLLCLTPFVYTQGQTNINPQNVNVEDLTDDQILQMIREADSRGLSDEDMMSVARMKGATETQIYQIMARVNELRTKSGGAAASKANGQASNQVGSPTGSDAGSISGAGVDYMQMDDLSIKQYFDDVEAKKTFGYKIFNSDYLTFDPAVNIPIPDNYNIGIGDEFIISVWGASQATYYVLVNNNGNIVIPDVVTTNVYGKTYKECVELIKKYLITIYSGMAGTNPNTFADVSLANTRSIKVNVVGEANIPGTYTVPATATVFNVLYLSGGPNHNGSFRSIQILRDGKRISTVDVYSLFLNEKLPTNINLKEGDIVYIPNYESKVSVEGTFNNTGLFEALPTTTVAEIIKLAGGFTDNAFQENLSMVRKTSTELQRKDIPKEEFNTFVVKNGDEITATELLNRYENRVILTGAVFRPGEYELSEGLTLSGLIAKGEGLREDAFMERGLITRLKKDNSLTNISFSLKDVANGLTDVPLMREDSIFIHSIDSLKEYEHITVNGLVGKAGKFRYADNMTLADAIFKADGFSRISDIDQVEVSRIITFEEGLTYTDTLAHTFIFSMDRNLKLSNKDKNFKLEPFDVISVRVAAGQRKGGSATIMGEVMHMGSFAISNRKERISDLVKRSGGLTPHAYPEAAVLIRQVTLTKEEKIQREHMMEKDSSIDLSEESFKQIAIELDEILKNPGGINDLYLFDGDKVIIPRVLQTVNISGNVNNPIDITYTEGAKAKRYIKQSGGFAPRPKRNSVYVVAPNGLSTTTKNFLFFRKYPKVTRGSQIIVPARPPSNMNASTWIAITTGLSGLAVSITSLANILKD